MTKPTPGPWSIEPGSAASYNTYTIVKGPDGIAVARVPISAQVDRQAMCKANARLVMAAPDLLEACRAVVNSKVGLDVGIALCNAAITKAEKGR